MIALALLIEALVGYPDRLFRAVGHPVTWMGAMIGWMDRRWNSEGAAVGIRRRNSEGAADGIRRRRGVAAVVVLLAISGLAASVVQAVLGLLPSPWAVLGTALVASTLLAQRSLHQFVAAVGIGLRTGGLPGGRAAVAHIVGRSPEALDEPAVIRAAIESLAENFSDGVVAPAMWGMLGGLPGIAAYKALNTADSMIGHLTPRHRAFGWATARLDDVANLLPSRLAALWIVGAACLHPGASARGAWQAVWRDAGHHRSPNAGWPEAAMAGAFGLRLAGPRRYGDTLVEDAWMGDGRAEATLADLDHALALYRTACALQVAALALLVMLPG